MNNGQLCSGPGRRRLVQSHLTPAGDPMLPCSPLLTGAFRPQRKHRHLTLSSLPAPRQAKTPRSGVRTRMTLGILERATQPNQPRTPKTPPNRCLCSDPLTRPQSSFGEREGLQEAKQSASGHPARKQWKWNSNPDPRASRAYGLQHCPKLPFKNPQVTMSLRVQGDLHRFQHTETHTYTHVCPHTCGNTHTHTSTFLTRQPCQGQPGKGPGDCPGSVPAPPLPPHLEGASLLPQSPVWAQWSESP